MILYLKNQKIYENLFIPKNKEGEKLNRDAHSATNKSMKTSSRCFGYKKYEQTSKNKNQRLIILFQ